MDYTPYVRHTFFFFFSSRRRHTRSLCDWSSDVCSSDLKMTLSPFSKPTIAPKERWLKNAKAAEILGVDARTIKRWMKNPELRNALGAVRHGKQWRIPQPKSFNGDSEGAWESHARYNLKEIGIPLKARWQKALEESGRQFERNKLETYRLWLAAHLHLSVKPKAVTKEAITAILLLWQTVCEILESLPRGTEVDKLKSQFPERLKARDFSDERIHSIMSYWPDEKCFKIVHEAHTLKQLEIIRRRMDTMQAARTCENLGKKPTAKNLRPYLHKDIIEHINDTRDEPPKGFTVVNNPTAD